VYGSYMNYCILNILVIIIALLGAKSSYHVELMSTNKVLPPFETSNEPGLTLGDCDNGASII
jgi:hypothetical protein